MVKRLVVNNDPVDLQIWDFGGEDRFRFILPSYCLGAHGALFMYDICNPASLYHMDSWMMLLRSQNGKFPVMAAGTKADLNYARKVEVGEAIKLAGKYGITEVVEVSSKTGHNVDLLFDGICQLMITQSHQKAPAKPRPQTCVPAPTTTVAPVAQTAVAHVAQTAVAHVAQTAVAPVAQTAVAPVAQTGVVNAPQHTSAAAPQRSIATAPETQVPPNPETWDQKV